MIVRIIFILSCGLAGLFLFLNGLETKDSYIIGISGAFLTAALGLVIEQAIRRSPTGVVLGAAAGLFSGILAAGSIVFTAGWLLPEVSPFRFPAQIFLLLILGYVGLIIGMTIGRGLQPRGTVGLVRTSSGEVSRKILDTSVIIEGRIADLVETGFLEGTFIIPQFILHELQHIADSSDSMKRARGRRGLDILHRIQKMVDIDVRIVENDFPRIRDVDAKLVALAKEMDARIITNDLNLNKVAELQGVRVLNINDLSNALKPVVLPGEVLHVFVLKEGKEAGQGVAYLDDGTMIVVDNAKRLIGKNVDAVVTSVLQTTAGRMIFTRLREGGEKEREEVQVSRENT